MAAHHKKKIPWEKVIMALGFCSLLIGVFYIYTYDRYDPSRLQVGVCAAPQAVHRVLWGRTHQTSEESERSRASSADERCVSAVSAYTCV